MVFFDDEVRFFFWKDSWNEVPWVFPMFFPFLAFFYLSLMGSTRFQHTVTMV